MSPPRRRRVEPLKDLGGRLLEVEKPARYLGGEVGSIRKEGEGFFDIAICFPDLYEIGMSNNAIRLLYSGLNSMPNVRAERVFAPAPDFEALLASLDLPLYTLETGIALSNVDMLGFSIGYELAATSMLAILESGQVPMLAEKRGEGDPIVIAGGPAATNPHPFAQFLDAAFIGEAEEIFFDVCEDLARMKKAGADRSSLLDRLAREPAIWMPGTKGPAAKVGRRAVFWEFPDSPASTAFPLPTVKTVQDHGTVEIMRGCPNGCRFCHAGFYYRPQREKPYAIIRAEVEELVAKGGYREITLASLSSGDYQGIGGLLDRLNAEYSSRKISFQLPSLKVNSFTLPIISKLAEVRRSGLTFAVETPVDEWQRSINKEVSFEKIVAILGEAKASGFRQAKFYFMIGLPVPGRGMGEAEAIVDFLKQLQSRISMPVSVNVGVFVPKPHTPFQWASQLTEEEGLAAINFLRTELKRYRNIKLSYHSPFNSQLEGIIARGDERVGALILAAYRKGARLDAWEEHFDRDLWRSVIEEAPWPVVEEFCREKEHGSILPWADVQILVSQEALGRESARSNQAIVTSACMENCTEPCGVCTVRHRVVRHEEPLDAKSPSSPLLTTENPLPRRVPAGRMVFRYRKRGIAAYYQHLSIIDAFNRALLISGIDVAYSEGFNPMPRLETTQPISIAVESEAEMASVLLYQELAPERFTASVNSSLPSGLSILEASYFTVMEGRKQRTIGSLEWGSEYEILGPTFDENLRSFARLQERVAALAIPGALIWSDSRGYFTLRLKLAAKKEFGLLRLLETCCDRRPIQAGLSICRTKVFASDASDQPISFFEAYRE